ncbi:MAG TPA: hypothetical protein VD833_06370 [Vicinamibacterales bacterium]|nr:hypothetical protein [Vicinamibacterales bacterium]
MRRLLPGLVCLQLLNPAVASGQSPASMQPRRQFVTISYDWLYNQSLRFDEHPLEDLLGTDVAAAQFEEYEYRTRDGRTRIDVLEFTRRTQGAGVTLYPLGLSAGATLGIRASVENLPTIRIAFDGPDALDSYTLTDARAYDVAAGVHVADRSAGWGLGSVAFAAAGLGRMRSSLGDGRRYFAEAGGALRSGPVGVELAVKFAWNHLDAPVDHGFLTVPITIRGTVSF